VSAESETVCIDVILVVQLTTNDVKTLVNK